MSPQQHTTTGPQRNGSTTAGTRIPPANTGGASSSTATAATHFSKAIDNNTGELQNMIIVLSGLQNNQKQTVPAQPQQAEGLTTEKRKDFQKETNRKCEAILRYDMEKVNPQRPADWISSLQKLLETYRVEYLEDDELTEYIGEKRIPTEIRERLDTAGSVMQKNH